jgi:hypothetical protein
MQTDDDEFDEYEPDEFEEAMSNCCGFFDGGYFVCAAAGSEDCDWDCPFSHDLGLTAKQIEQRDIEEEAREAEGKPNAD